MRSARFAISSRREMDQLGKRLAKLLRPGDVVGLSGDLGAGKTHLAGAIAHALGVPRNIPVTSPTFTLIKEYAGTVPVYHMDLFRLGDPSELYELGLSEYYEGDGVCLVEWCDKYADLWPAEALVLSIDLGEGEARTVRAEGQGRGAEIIDKMTSW